MVDDIEIKLSAARTRLILDKPFLGALVLRLPLKQGNASWCKSTATDAKTFYYNADYIRELSLEETQFVLAHEALHCALSHFARRQHRVKHRWDLACDLAVNPMLIEDGLQPPEDALYIEAFDGMIAEEIYPMLDDKEDLETHDQHIYDQEEESDSSRDNLSSGGAGQQSSQSNGEASEAELDQNAGGGSPQPPPLTRDEGDQLSTQWQQRLAGAAQQAMQAGKMGKAMARLIDHLLQPQLPWQMLLARYMTAVARDDFSYTRPSRREGSAIFPSLRSSQVDVVVAIDTSGSIAQTEMEAFMSEVDAIKGQVRARISLLACDDHVAEQAPWQYEVWDEFALPDNIAGGGGTNFRPVFEWVEQQDKQPDLLVYFTDADGTFPEWEPHYPVIWLVKGKYKTPWGQRVQLN